MSDAEKRTVTSFSRYTPPGMGDIKQLRVTVVMALLFIAVAGTIGFALHYRAGLGECYAWYKGRQVLMAGSHIPDFSAMLQHCFVGFWMYLTYLVGVAGANYYSFYNPAKSIYVMKRIPDAGEIHRRCLTIPLLGFALGILLMIICTACFGLYYQLATPAEVYPVMNLTQLWRALL